MFYFPALESDILARNPTNTKLLSSDIGCGAVWGENIPGHTHPRVLVISSDVPAYELVVAAVIPGNGL